VKYLRRESPFSQRALWYDLIIAPKRIQMQLEGIPNFEKKYTDFYPLKNTVITTLFFSPPLLPHEKTGKTQLTGL
jgi:hypothetical protein